MDDAVSIEERGTSRFERAYVRHEYAVVYVVAGTTYTLAALHAKVLLNWLVGPLWPVMCMWWGPRIVRRITGWTASLP